MIDHKSYREVSHCVLIICMVVALASILGGCPDSSRGGPGAEPAYGFFLGTIMEMDTGILIGGARISTDLDESTTSRPDGTWEIFHPPGIFTLRFEASGYEPANCLYVTLCEGMDVQIEVRLAPKNVGDLGGDDTQNPDGNPGECLVHDGDDEEDCPHSSGSSDSEVGCFIYQHAGY